jgi:chromate reductase, NAD(P)H dehydrogenase (quinone)
MKPKILAFAGSLREGSFNKKLIRVGGQMAREAGAEVTLIDLREFPMPIYDGDLESAEGLPEHAVRLKELMLSHQGFLISSAEYNSSVSAALKNAIDWASRPREGEGRLECFEGKIAGLLSASPGALGGLRGLYQLRWILTNVGTVVVPKQVAVSGANEAFAEDGSLKDEGRARQVRGVVENLVETVGKFQPPCRG